MLALANLPEQAATEDELSDLLGGARVSSPLRLLRERGVLGEEWRVLPPKTGANS